MTNIELLGILDLAILAYAIIWTMSRAGTNKKKDIHYISVLDKRYDS